MSNEIRVCDCGNEHCADFMKDCFGLTYDPEFMEGSLSEYEDEFECLDSLSQADLLKDWIGLLQDKYDAVIGPGFLEDIKIPTESVN